jgi:hypothetical protein
MKAEISNWVKIYVHWKEIYGMEKETHMFIDLYKKHHVINITHASN